MRPLEERFARFMTELAGVECIDSVPKSDYRSGEKIADYLCTGRRLILEQKAITEDQAGRIQSIIDEHQNEPYYPFFYGTRDLELILEQFPNAEDVRNRIYTQITRVLEGYLSQAKKQIAGTKRAFSIPDSCGGLILLNDKVKVLSPEVIVHRIQQRLKQRDNSGGWRFGAIPFVLLISETHHIDGRPFCCTVEGPLADRFPFVHEFLDYMLNAWAYVNGGDLLRLDSDSALKNMEARSEPAPEVVTRGEERRIWYASNPYMSSWSDTQVIESCRNYIETTAPFFLKGGPRLPKHTLGEVMLCFSDFISEFNRRGIDMRQLGDIKIPGYDPT